MTVSHAGRNFEACVRKGGAPTVILGRNKNSRSHCRLCLQAKYAGGHLPAGAHDLALTTLYASLLACEPGPRSVQMQPVDELCHLKRCSVYLPCIHICPVHHCVYDRIQSLLVRQNPEFLTKRVLDGTGGNGLQAEALGGNISGLAGGLAGQLGEGGTSCTKARQEVEAEAVQALGRGASKGEGAACRLAGALPRAVTLCRAYP